MHSITAAEAMSMAEGVSSIGVGEDKWSQASTRDYRIFTDQWGREWGADCEIKTGHPCGPLAPVGWRAPIYPPSKYLRITDTMRRMLRVDVRQWIDDLLERAVQFSVERQAHAQRLFGNRSADVIREAENGNVDPTLFALIGKRPMPIDVVQAMIHSNPWVLGMKNPDGSMPKKPAKAPRDYFPDTETLRARDPFALEHDPWADDGGQVAVTEPTAYPRMSSPGKWLLSAEHEAAYEAGTAKAFQGKKADALAEMAKGTQPEIEKVDNPWED